MQMTSFTLAGPFGSDALAVSIQCAIDAAKPTAFLVTGVSAVQSKEISVRVRSALSGAGPLGQVTINIDAQGGKILAPAFDLPIALAVMGVDVNGLLVAGELGLDGSVRAVRGALQAALLAKTLGLRGVLVPAQNAREVLEGLEGSGLAVHTISHLSEITVALATVTTHVKLKSHARQAIRTIPDFSDVRGQAAAIAAVEQSVQSRKGLLLSGPPGTGKTMIARRIPSLLPRMQRDEQLSVTCTYSALGLAEGLVTERPFRAPHHTISAAALTGSRTRPGEVQLAAHGVLFLDEVQEFSRLAIDALAAAINAMPEASRPLVVASANACPCGWQDSGVRACTCSEASVKMHAERVQRVVAKLGLSVSVPVSAVSLADLRSAMPGESSASIAERIGNADQARKG